MDAEYTSPYPTKPLFVVSLTKTKYFPPHPGCLLPTIKTFNSFNSKILVYLGLIAYWGVILVGTFFHIN